MNSFIKELKDKTPLASHKYFSSLMNGSMSLELFKYSQLNFYSAVCYFSRPMFLLCSKMDSYTDRLTLLENIMDEHGNGDISNTHGETFKKYLLNLGINDRKISEKISHPAVANFYSIIEKTINDSKIETAIAMLGIIEDRYAEISSSIALSTVKNGWLNTSQLVHYKNHQELDIYHAELFYKLVRNKWKEEESRLNIKKGLKEGNKVILDIYLDLVKSYNLSNNP